MPQQHMTLNDKQEKHVKRQATRLINMLFLMTQQTGADDVSVIKFNLSIILILICITVSLFRWGEIHRMMQVDVSPVKQSGKSILQK